MKYYLLHSTNGASREFVDCQLIQEDLLIVAKNIGSNSWEKPKDEYESTFIQRCIVPDEERNIQQLEKQFKKAATKIKIESCSDEEAAIILFTGIQT